MLTRRGFLGSALAAAAGLASGSLGQAIEPIRRVAGSHLKLSLAAYSFRKHLDREADRKPTMTLDEFVDLAATLNVDAIEPTSYYFPEVSLDYLVRLKGRCTRQGLDISSTAVKNSFTNPDPKALDDDIVLVKQWLEHSSLLGAKTLRIFAGKLSEGDSEEQARARCRDAILRCCDHAAKWGVFVALENHHGIVETVEQTLAIAESIDHPWFGINWDSGNFTSADPYADLARLAPYAVNAQIKCFMRREKGEREPADLGRLIGILRASGYRGYVALEYEGDEEPHQAVPQHLAELRRLIRAQPASSHGE